MRAYRLRGTECNSRHRAAAWLVGLALVLVAGTAGAADRTPRLLAIGDSLTAGYGLEPAQGFTERLAAALAPGGPVIVVNAGVSGDTSAAGPALLDWQLADRPDAVLLELGANDMLRGIDPAETGANLARMLERLQGAHIPVLLCGMQASLNWGADYKARYDALFPALASRFHVPLYPFFLDGVALDPALMQPDGLHPNAAGVDIIVARIRPAVEALLGRRPG